DGAALPRDLEGEAEAGDAAADDEDVELPRHGDRIRPSGAGASGRCISTVSSQRPNLKPTSRSTPTVVKPSPACSRTEATLAESPITATIWRKPRASLSAIGRARRARPMPRAAQSGCR